MTKLGGVHLIRVSFSIGRETGNIKEWKEMSFGISQTWLQLLDLLLLKSYLIYLGLGCLTCKMGLLRASPP